MFNNYHLPRKNASYRFVIFTDIRGEEDFRCSFFKKCHEIISPVFRLNFLTCIWNHASSLFLRKIQTRREAGTARHTSLAI